MPLNFQFELLKTSIAEKINTYKVINITNLNSQPESD